MNDIQDRIKYEVWCPCGWRGLLVQLGYDVRTNKYICPKCNTNAKLKLMKR